jgi:hypothetical protein
MFLSLVLALVWGLFGYYLGRTSLLKSEHKNDKGDKIQLYQAFDCVRQRSNDKCEGLLAFLSNSDSPKLSFFANFEAVVPASYPGSIVSLGSPLHTGDDLILTKHDLIRSQSFDPQWAKWHLNVTQSSMVMREYADRYDQIHTKDDCLVGVGYTNCVDIGFQATDLFEAIQSEIDKVG